MMRALRSDSEEGCAPEQGPAERDRAERERRGSRFVRWLLAALCLAAFLASFAAVAYASLTFAQAASDGGAGKPAGIISLSLAAASLASCALAALMAAGVLAGRRHRAERLAWALAAITALQIVGALMLYGLSVRHAGYLVQLVAAVSVAICFDPFLADERARWRARRKRTGEGDGLRPPAQDGRPKRGFVKLNFFNLVWGFVVCSVAGLAVETAYHVLVVQPGQFQDRAGLLFGPFSPIYGFGAVLMTVALNRFHDKNVVLVFVVSAVVGGAFEYAVSWIMQFSFGLVAWNYSGTFLSIDGRTNGMFMAMWGLLGVVWIKLLLPLVLRLVHLMPWRWRFGVTTVCAALLLLDGVMTVQSVDCWYQREAGRPVDTPVERFYADHFDDAYMQSRFQSMSMNVHEAARVDR